MEEKLKQLKDRLQTVGDLSSAGSVLGSLELLPGETKIELDRRRIHTRMSKLRKQIKGFAPAREAKRADGKQSVRARIKPAGFGVGDDPALRLKRGIGRWRWQCAPCIEPEAQRLGQTYRLGEAEWPSQAQQRGHPRAGCDTVRCQ